MTLVQTLRQQRNWFPIPATGVRPKLIQWVLLDANRLAVTGALLTLVFATIMMTGRVWTLEMQVILTESSTVETLLETFLGGIILLVSIVVSINSIVLSQDITSIGSQEDRVRGVMEFRREIGNLTKSGEPPTDPAAFLDVMSSIISERARNLTDETDHLDDAVVEEIQDYADSVVEIVDEVGEIDKSSGADLALLWMTFELDYGRHYNRSRSLRSSGETSLSQTADEPLDGLVEALQLFAIGRGYFKTLYYTKEVSRLSRTLLIFSLPAVLTTAIAILAISANLFPQVWVFGLPPLQSFVATMFTISLVPYIILTSYMLRLSTVAMRTATGGPFSLK